MQNMHVSKVKIQLHLSPPHTFSAMQGRTQVGAQGDPGLPWIQFFF